MDLTIITIILKIFIFIVIFLWSTTSFKLIMTSTNPTPKKRLNTEISASDSNGKTYLSVSYAEKDEAKSLGAQFDWDEKKWFAPNNEPELVNRWGTSSPSASKKQSLERDKDNDLIGIQYLYVPFDKKDKAKAMGAKFDWDQKKWYAPNNENYLVTRWGFNDKSLTELIEEDKTFGGNQLFVDLIPSSCWFTNVRYCVDPKDWERLRKYVYGRANYKCEVC